MKYFKYKKKKIIKHFSEQRYKVQINKRIGKNRAIKLQDEKQTNIAIIQRHDKVTLHLY